MMSRVAIALLVGIATFATVFLIARVEPVVYGILFGAIGAAAMFAIIGILKSASTDPH